VARSHEPPWHEPSLEAERILVVDLSTTQDQANGAFPSINRKEGQTKAVVAKPLNVLSPHPANRVDKLHRQLVEIHAIAAA
jgi:hypothetical protein